MQIGRRGFTLIELLIVIVIIGILAAIALPKFREAREMAYYSALKSDLRSLASVQEIHYGVHTGYTTDFTALGFQASEHVNMSPPQLIGSPANQAWSAYATHDALGASVGCVVYHGAYTGTVTEVGVTATEAGIITCSE